MLEIKFNFKLLYFKQKIKLKTSHCQERALNYTICVIRKSTKIKQK